MSRLFAALALLAPVSCGSPVPDGTTQDTASPGDGGGATDSSALADSGEGADSAPDAGDDSGSAAKPDPTISNVDGGEVQPGQTTTLEIVGEGFTADTPPTLDLGDELTVSNVQIISDNLIYADVTAPSDASCHTADTLTLTHAWATHADECDDVGRACFDSAVRVGVPKGFEGTMKLVLEEDSATCGVEVYRTLTVTSTGDSGECPACAWSMAFDANALGNETVDCPDGTSMQVGPLAYDGFISMTRVLGVYTYGLDVTPSFIPTSVSCDALSFTESFESSSLGEVSVTVDLVFER